MLKKITHLTNHIPEYGVQYIKNLSWLMLLRILQRVLGFVFIYFLVRALTKEDFGNYQFVITVVLLLSGFTLPGLANALVQSVARGYYGTIIPAIKIAFKASLIGSFILAVISLYYWNIGDDKLSVAFMFTAILFPFSYSMVQWKSYKTGMENFSSLAKIESLFFIVTYSLMIMSVIIIPGNLLLPLFILFLLFAATNIFLSYRLSRVVAGCDDIEENSIEYGIKTNYYFSINLISNNFDKFLIFVLLSPALLALYVAAERISEIINELIQDVAMVLAPKFAKTDNYSKKLDYILNILGVILAILIIAFSFTALPFLFILLFGDQYSDAIVYAQALLCSIAIGNVAILKFRFISSKLDSDSYKTITLWMSSVKIISSLVLIPIMGVVGAIVSAFIYRISMSIVTHVMIKNKYL